MSKTKKTNMARGRVFKSKGGKKYPGKLTLVILVTCIVAAMAGIVFGYDMGISRGVTSMPMFLKEIFPNVPLTLLTSSWYVVALLSSLVVTLVASTVTRKFGFSRRLSKLSGGAVFCAGALINALAVNVGMLILGRVLLGF